MEVFSLSRVECLSNGRTAIYRSCRPSRILKDKPQSGFQRLSHKNFIVYSEVTLSRYPPCTTCTGSPPPNYILTQLVRFILASFFSTFNLIIDLGTSSKTEYEYSLKLAGAVVRSETKLHLFSPTHSIQAYYQMVASLMSIEAPVFILERYRC